MKKRNSEKKSYGKDIENEELKTLRSFSQPKNEPTQFKEKDEYKLFGKYVASKMRKLSSLLNMEQMGQMNLMG